MRYPGFRAPASLKREKKWKKSFGAPQLSGVSCPGLIEAPNYLHLADHFPDCYPGFRAPASLKRKNRRQLVAI